MSILQAEDYFLNMAQLAKQFTPMRETKPGAIPLVFNKCQLVVHQLPVAYRVVQALEAFVDVATNFECSYAVLEPRLIGCSREVLQRYVAALSRIGPARLNIDLVGYNPPGAFDLDAIDIDAHDRSDLIRTVFQAIASCANIGSVNISGLLALCQNPNSVNRASIFYEALASLLSGPHKMDTLAIKPGVQLFENDVQKLNDARIALQAKEENVGKKLCVRVLHVEFTRANMAFIDGLVDAFDDIEELRICNEDSERMPSEMVTKMLTKYTHLKDLSLWLVEIDSMAIFQERQQPLESIKLQDLELFDTSSLLTFLLALKSGSTDALARSLHCFQITRDELADSLAFDLKAANLLDDALTQNKVLEDVCCTLTVNSDETEEAATRLQLLHGDIVAPLRDARLRARSERLAFLSVVSRPGEHPSSGLDALALRTIFEFSAPHGVRYVWNPYASEPESDDGDHDD